MTGSVQDHAALILDGVIVLTLTGLLGVLYWTVLSTAAGIAAALRWGGAEIRRGLVSAAANLPGRGRPSNALPLPSAPQKSSGSSPPECPRLSPETQWQRVIGILWDGLARTAAAAKLHGAAADKVHAAQYAAARIGQDLAALPVGKSAAASVNAAGLPSLLAAEVRRKKAALEDSRTGTAGPEKAPRRRALAA